jgi:hypothetical protein
MILLKKSKQIILFLEIGYVLFCAFQYPLFAGAWSQQKGHYYTKMTFIYSDATGIYGSTSPAEFKDYAVYFYGEYGLFNRTSIILSTPFFKQSQNEANFVRGQTTGYLAGDLELQAKYQFLSKPVVASVLGGAKIPVAYDIVDNPPLGNGETDFDAKFLLGASFYPIPAYATGDVGYRLRGGQFSDELHYNLEAGYTLFNKFLLKFMFNGIRHIQDVEGESNLFGFPLAQDRTRIGGGLIVLLSNHVEIEVDYLDTTSGLNIPKTKEVFVGIAWKR